MTPNQETKIRSLGDELVKMLIDMTDEEKSIALAMIQGMVVGKQIAEKSQKESA